MASYLTSADGIGQLAGIYGELGLLPQETIDRIIYSALAQSGISDPQQLKFYGPSENGWSAESLPYEVLQALPAGMPLKSTAYQFLSPEYNPNIIDQGFVDKWGRTASQFDPNQYNIMLGTDPSSGFDNKDATVQSWIDAGGFYDPSQNYYDRWYYVPKQFTPPPTASNPNPTAVPNTAPLGEFVDKNPEVVDEWGLIPYLLPLALGAIGGGALGLFGGGSVLGGEALAGAAADGFVETAASPFFNTAWNAGNAAALNLGGVASAVPELNLLGAGASSLASTIPSLANALSVYGVTPIPSQAVYDAASMISTTTPWDQTKNFLQDNAGSIAKTAGSLFQQPAGQVMPSMPDFSIGSASGGTQPTSQRSIGQQQQSQAQQLSVPQFTEARSPQQDSGNYQNPQYMDASQTWGQPSIFQLSESTWNPSMANALRQYNG